MAMSKKWKIWMLKRTLKKVENIELLALNIFLDMEIEMGEHDAYDKNLIEYIDGGAETMGLGSIRMDAQEVQAEIKRKIQEIENNG
jgi:hypothetical protein